MTKKRTSKNSVADSTTHPEDKSGGWIEDDPVVRESTIPLRPGERIIKIQKPEVVDDRIESFTRTLSDGCVVIVTRNLETGEQTVTYS